MAKTYGDLSKVSGPTWIGIDQSYSGFGLTAIDSNDNYYTEVWKLDGVGVHRLDTAGLLLHEFVKRFDVQAVAMEGYAFSSQMAHMAGELGGAVKLELLRNFTLDKPDARYPLIVAPTSLKKYVTGKGTQVQKNQMLLQVYKKWGVEFNDDNAADSYGVARIARNKHDFEYEIEVYDKVVSPRK
jgi:Holliday junction resolvasome RuvABC endonuclease subunit